MSLSETILACASGRGRSPRAIVRVFGEGSRALLGRVCRPAPGAGGMCGAAMFAMGGGRELPCLVIRYDAPRSYTGEDGFELIVPGNALLLDRVARRLLAEAGAGGLAIREAEPGEFSARAYLNGKMTIEEAESIAAVIAAQTQEQLTAAGDLLAGRTGARYHEWVEELATMLALVEAGIDFTDQEDVIPIGPADLESRLAALIASIRAELGSTGGSERVSGLPRVVLAGAPNAGKSTLFNALLGRKRAVESPIAGTTRDVIAERLDLSGDVPGGVEVMLVDLAGLDDRPLAGEIEAAAQALAREEVARADVLVHCDPAGHFAEALGGGAARAVIRVRTKADLPDSGEVAQGAIVVCAIDGWRLAVLRRAIADAAWGAGSRAGGSAWLVPRHRRALAAALERLEPAHRSAGEQHAAGTRAVVGPELIAGELRGALDLMGELVGRIGPDDIIGRVFATFCVGK